MVSLSLFQSVVHAYVYSKKTNISHKYLRPYCLATVTQWWSHEYWMSCLLNSNFCNTELNEIGQQDVNEYTKQNHRDTEINWYHSSWSWKFRCFAISCKSSPHGTNIHSHTLIIGQDLIYSLTRDIAKLPSMLVLLLVFTKWPSP